MILAVTIVMTIWAIIAWPVALWSLFNYPRWGVGAYVAVAAPAVWFMWRYIDGLS